MNFKVIYSRHSDSSRISVWVDAPSNKDARDRALDMIQVRDFLAGYEGFYDCAVINTSTLEEAKLRMFPKLNFN